MLIAGLGDVHGRWREAFALVEAACAQAGVAPAELAAVFQVGDAEPQRTQQETDQVPVPAKYRKLGDCGELVRGELAVPAPVWFIAGNHEPFEALDRQGPGPWAPGLTYLGRSGRVTIGGLDVAFLSGVYGESTFRASAATGQRPSRGRPGGHYTAAELATVRAALADGGRPDLLITHAWPAGLGPAGDQRVRDLIDAYQPVLTLHGHHHVPHAATLGATTTACLAIVGYRYGNPLAAVGLWDIDPTAKTVQRLL
jgi:hypothetical protein